MTTIIQNFTLVSFNLHRNASPSQALTWSRGSFSAYALVSLRTQLFMITRKDDNISSYALDHLHLTLHCLRSRKIFPAVGTICTLPTCCGMRIIIFRASLDSVESERLVECNRVCSSFVQMSASSSRVYWLAGEGSPLVCHWYWSGLMAR